VLTTRLQASSSGAGSALPGVHVLGWGFSEPNAIAVAGDDLFVANLNGKSVTELNASTGALVRVVSDQFGGPYAMAVAGADLFVANHNGTGSVIEFNASRGTPVRVVYGPVYRFNDPDAMAVAGDDLFVANHNGTGSVTELDASTGALVNAARPQDPMTTRNSPRLRLLADRAATSRPINQFAGTDPWWYGSRPRAAETGGASPRR